MGTALSPRAIASARTRFLTTIAVTTLLLPIGAGAQSLTVPTPLVALDFDPITVVPMSSSIKSGLVSDFNNGGDWLATHPTRPNSFNCANVKKWTLDALAGKAAGGDNWFFANDTVAGGTAGAHYPGYHETVLSSSLSSGAGVTVLYLRGTVIHEAYHHANPNSSEADADDAIKCFNPNKARQQDDDGDNGGGGGGGTGYDWLTPGMLQECEVFYESDTSCLTMTWATGGQEWCFLADLSDWGGGIEQICVTDDDGDGYFSHRVCNYTGYWIQICTGAQSMASVDREICVVEDNGIRSATARREGEAGVPE